MDGECAVLVAAGKAVIDGAASSRADEVRLNGNHRGVVARVLPYVDIVSEVTEAKGAHARVVTNHDLHNTCKEWNNRD